MMTESEKIYFDIFNDISNNIKSLEKEIIRLKKLQIEMEEFYISDNWETTEQLLCRYIPCILLHTKY